MTTIPSVAGKIMTVRGPMDPQDLGVTLMHEHIFFDLRKVVTSGRSPIGSPPRQIEKISLETLDLARGGKLLDNLFMRDQDVAISEVLEFKAAGGNTIVDVSPIGLLRDTRALRHVSDTTGVNIIMGTGFFAWAFPEDMDQRTVEDLTQEIVEDVTVGIDGSGIRSGIIGEVGIEGNPLTDREINGRPRRGARQRGHRDGHHFSPGWSGPGEAPGSWNIGRGGSRPQPGNHGPLRLDRQRYSFADRDSEIGSLCRIRLPR